MSHEVWRTLRDFSDYEVSGAGLVRSRDRFSVDTSGPYKGRRRFWKSRIIKPGISKSLGYQVVVLRKDNKSHTRYVHLLVAQEFMSPKPEGCEINHKDGNKANPDVCNLKWKTHQYNSQHSIDTGLRRWFVTKDSRTRNPRSVT